MEQENIKILNEIIERMNKLKDKEMEKLNDTNCIKRLHKDFGKRIDLK